MRRSSSKARVLRGTLAVAVAALSMVAITPATARAETAAVESEDGTAGSWTPIAFP
jgi:hypothetical protein